MKKFLKWTAIVLGGLLILGIVGFNLLMWQTKKASPQDIASFNRGDAKIEVVYCQPHKNKREIFGELVPYGEVWRTGANEATTFTTNVPINFGDTEVPAGKYTLWTIPNPNSWEVILNDKEYGWGVAGFGNPPKAAREAEYDIANITVPVIEEDKATEQFTIMFDAGMDMHLIWDQTHVAVPISKP